MALANSFCPAKNISLRVYKVLTEGFLPDKYNDVFLYAIYLPGQPDNVGNLPSNYYYCNYDYKDLVCRRQAAKHVVDVISYRRSYSSSLLFTLV